MGVEGFDHLYVETHHFDRARAFWLGLGFVVEQAWGEGEHRACLLGAGSAHVVLASAHGPEAGVPTAHLRMASGEEMTRRLAEAGAAVEVVTPLEDTHWGSRWIRVRDPDGNVYALEEPGR